MTIKEVTSGDQFGNWTVIELVESTANGKRMALCECSCGKRFKVIVTNMTSGLSEKCKYCGRKKVKRGPKLTHDKIKLIVEAYVSGESSIKLARQFDVGYGSVLNYVKQAGYKLRTNAEHALRTRKSPGVAAKNNKYKQYKSQAKYRGIEFCLTKEEFLHKTGENCYYCGVAPSNECKASSGSYVYSGLDRINSDKGYSVDNIVPCCIVCNRAKGDMSYAEFISWLYGLAERYSGLSSSNIGNCYGRQLVEAVKNQGRPSTEA